MRKILVTFLTLILLFGAIPNSFAQSPDFRLPAFARNSTEDSNVSKNASMQFTLTQDGKLFYKSSLITQERLPQTIKDHFDKQLPVRHAYVKGDVEARIGNLLKLSEGLISAGEITDVRLVVIPYMFAVIPSENVQETMERSRIGYTLRLRISNKDIERKIEIERKNAERRVVSEDEAPPPVPIRKGEKVNQTKVPPRSLEISAPIVIAKKSISKTTVNGVATSEKELFTVVKKRFKEREEKGVYRYGRNEIDKSIALQLSPNLQFKHLIVLLDGLYGIGADRIVLKIDEIPQ